VQRQVQREGAALARRAGQADLAAQQLGQLAADRQAQAGAAVLAAGGAVGLLEGLEDDLLLVAEMPMPVSDTENATTCLARFSSSWSELQPVTPPRPSASRCPGG
jgi:hypothetical protein